MLLSLENVTFGYLGTPNLEDVSFSLSERERVGLLGANGAGKTTLLKLILGQLSPDRGSVFVRSGIKIGYLEQGGGLEGGKSVYEAMREVFSEDEALLSKLAAAQEALGSAGQDEIKALSQKIEQLLSQISARDSYHADVKIKTVLNGMGFEGRYEQIISTMSGGEKTRLKLCKLLLEAPDLLILDEPTNHLDLKTLFFLEDYLLSVKCALLVVSHDRYFLDRVTGRTLELERGKLTSFSGSYSKYLVLKQEKYKSELAAYERQQEEISRLQTYVDRNLVRATTASSAQSRVNKLKNMQLLEKPLPPPPPPRFAFSFSQKPYETVIFAEKLELSAGGKQLLHGGPFTLKRGEKCALVGDNGTGKSTLLKFLLQEGRGVVHGKFAKIAYFDQEGANLPPKERVLDFFWGNFPALSRTEAQKTLALAGLCEADAEKTVEELSGGLRAKLALSLLMAQRANVLFLDEPTNHLDLPARESLEAALSAYEGTLLFVSHDRRFLERIANRIVCLENGTLTLFSGSYGEFLNAKAAAKEQNSSPAPQQKAQNNSGGGYRSKEERAAQAKKADRIRAIESQLERLEAEEQQLNSALLEHAADYRKVREISDRLSALRTQSDALYAEYETLI